MSEYDIVILGAGSGGLGAAITAGRAGLKVLLVEKFSRIGGTAVWGGVNTWEPGVCSSKLPLEIYERLSKIPKAVGIYTMLPKLSLKLQPDEPPFPGGENFIDPTKSYEDSLLRHGLALVDDPAKYRQEKWHGVVFEPEAYEAVVRQMLDETGNCEILCDTTFSAVDHSKGMIKSLTLSNGLQVTAKAFIDSTGDICLARAAGCETTTGLEAAGAYNEPSAPQSHEPIINGATQIYRITPKNNPGVDEVDSKIPTECWWAEHFPVACFNQYPCGDYNVNMLPTISGLEAMTISPELLAEETARRVKAHWRNCQQRFAIFRNLRMSMIFPLVGIRETHRLVGRYVLTQHDLLAGVSRQQHDDIIAIADHAMDTHGYGGCNELDEPYGIPLRCLQPKEFDNLLVACRGASFSALGASSCRLSRTMMSLGEAAANAISRQHSL